MNTATATIYANTTSGISLDKGGVYPITVTLTPTSGSVEKFNTTLIVAPKAGRFTTTNQNLVGKANEKPTVEVTGLGKNLSDITIDSDKLEWKAYLVRGGRNDFDNDSGFEVAKGYQVVASAPVKIAADKTASATFQAINYKENIGTEKLSVVTALVHKGTDSIYRGVLTKLSDSKIQATTNEFPTKPTLATTAAGDVTAKIGEDGATRAVVSYTPQAGGTANIILSKTNNTWSKSSPDTTPTVTVTAGENGTAIVTIPFGTAQSGTLVTARQKTDATEVSNQSEINVPSDTTAPVVKVVTGGTSSILPETRPANDAPAIYEVVQGQPFNPVLKAWDNFGKLTKFEVTGGNLPNGVTVNTANLSQTTKHLDENSAYSPTFTGSVPRNFTPGDYTREIKVSDGTTEKTYYFKYKVLPKPQAPSVAALTNGDVTITPATQDNANRVSFDYTNNASNPTKKTVTANKTNSGWVLTNEPTDGVTIDAVTGVITIKDREVKDNTQVVAKTVTSDNVESDSNSAESRVGDRERPVFEPNPDTTSTGTDGSTVVYVTPTEELSLNIG